MKEPVFLSIDDILLARADALEDLALSVAQGKTAKPAIAVFFRKHTRHLGH